MSKIAKRSNTKIKETGSFNFELSKYIPLKYQTILAFAVIILIFLIFYSPMYFGGMTFQSGDIITSHSLKTYVNQEREGYTLWVPYIFCGMPSYALACDYKWFNLMYVAIHAVRTIFSAPFSSEYTMWSFYLIVLAFTSFFLIKHLTKNTFLSLLGAIATSFSTGIILCLFIGHVTKLTTLCFYPLIFLMLLKFQEGIRLRDFAILIIALQLSVQGWHVQIIFYTLFSIGIYFLFFLIKHLIKKNFVELKKYFKSGLVFAAALIIALIIQSDNLTQIYEYNPYSTRGSESVTDITQGSAPKSSSSDFYQYATNWSFSPEEMLTFVVPSFYGFGSSKYSGPLTQNREVEVNTYFGQMMAVDVPMYMGIVIFFFGLLSLYLNRKNHFVQFLAVLIIVSLLISFGRTLPVLYNLMFYYFPFFDKFRVPSMILLLVQLSFPLLAVLGINRIIELKKQNDLQIVTIIKAAALFFTAALILSIILNSVITDWVINRVVNFTITIQAANQQKAQMFNALKDYIAEMFANDLMIGLALCSLAFSITYAYLKSKVSADILIVLLIVFSFFDLARIGNRGANYSPAANVNQLFSEPYYISAIKGFKNTEPYRLLNLKRDNSIGSLQQNSNFNAYFLQEDFAGYSSIKPRSYQDIIDVVGTVNETLWRMLNVKYVIIDQPVTFPGLELAASKDKDFVFLNTRALPRFYFVNSVVVDKGISILNKIKNNEFDPKQVAFVEETLKVDSIDSSTALSVTKYTDEKIILSTKTNGNNFLFIGNTYLPTGWKASIDGIEIKIYKANYGFSGLIVPKGEHTVQIYYAPTSFYISKYLALIFSSLTFLGLFIGLFIKKKTAEN
ncbi:MAG: YfhO family protein [bacterium]